MASKLKSEGGNLIPFAKKGDPRSDEYRSRQKGSASDKRKKAAILRGLKMAKPETIEKRCLQLATDPKTTALEIMKMIVVLKEKGGLKPETEIQLIRALSDAYRTVFGNKVQLDADVRLKTTSDMVIDRIRSYKTKTPEEAIEEGIEEAHKNG